MPNWCYNILAIRGSTSDLSKFKNFLWERAVELNKSGCEFSFHMFLPMPLELEGTVSPRPLTKSEIRDFAQMYQWSDEVLTERLAYAASDDVLAYYDALKARYGYSNWFDWCSNVWGTKWDACNVEVIKISRGINIEFNTAWVPPEGVVHEMARMFPSLKFRNRYTIEGYPGRNSYDGDPVEGESRAAELAERIRNFQPQSA